jgi:hypothetical protein
METERIALSQRERDRLKVLHEVKQEHLTQVEAARRLKLSDRQVATDADPHWRARRWSDRSPTARAAIEPQVGGGFGAEDSSAGSPALCRFWTHSGQRTFGPGWFAGEPRDAAEVDDQNRLVASSFPAMFCLSRR